MVISVITMRGVILYMVECDNKDHNPITNPNNEVKFIRLKEKYDFVVCNWCKHCRNRDANMILHQFKF